MCAKKEDKKKATIKVVTKNNPNGESSKQKLKELSEFLSATWSVDKNPK